MRPLVVSSSFKQTSCPLCSPSCHLSVLRHKDRRWPESLSGADGTSRLPELQRHPSQSEPLQLLAHARLVYGRAVTRKQRTPHPHRLSFRPRQREHPSFLFLLSSLLIFLPPFFSPFPAPHLFSISCGLDSWRQSSPRPLLFSRGQAPFLHSDQQQGVQRRSCLTLKKKTHKKGRGKNYKKAKNMRGVKGTGDAE